MREESPKDEEAARKRLSAVTPKSPLGGGKNGRGAVARRLQALRDSGPGSGTWGAWLKSRRRRASTRWGTVEATTRHRILAAVIVAAAAALIWFVLVPAAPCGFPGGDSCPPADDAIALVPDDALAYVHLEVDPDSDELAAATDIAGRVPLLAKIAVDGLSRVAGTEVEFGRQVEPWAGGEVALAALPVGVRGERVLMIAADDSDGAEQFAAELLGPKQSTEPAAGTDISIGRGGAAWALEDGFLMIGSRAGLAAMLEDEGPSLDGADGTGVIDELPADRLAYAYLSPDGARGLLGSGGLEPIDTFVDATATEGAAASLSADDSGLRLAVRSDLDPDRAADSPGFFAALPSFRPSLTSAIGPASLAYLGLGDPAAGVGDLLDQARSSSPGLVAAFRRASRDLGKQAGIDVGGDLLPLLGSEAALSLQPVAASGGEDVPGVTPDVATPYVSLVAKGVDSEAARQSLARLQEPVAKALAKRENGGPATFETIQIAGLQAQSLAISPAVDLTYATWDDLLVIATDSLGIEQARSLDSGLGDAAKYQDVTDGFPDSVSLLAYLDLTGLLNLGEQAGLATDPTYTTYAPDLRSLTAAALAVDGGDDHIDTDLRIAVGPRLVPETDASPLGGE